MSTSKNEQFVGSYKGHGKHLRSAWNKLGSDTSKRSSQVDKKLATIILGKATTV